MTLRSKDPGNRVGENDPSVELVMQEQKGGGGGRRKRELVL